MKRRWGVFNRDQGREDDFMDRKVAGRGESSKEEDEKRLTQETALVMIV